MLLRLLHVGLRHMGTSVGGDNSHSEPIDVLGSEAPDKIEDAGGIAYRLAYWGVVRERVVSIHKSSSSADGGCLLHILACHEEGE